MSPFASLVVLAFVLAIGVLIFAIGLTRATKGQMPAPTKNAAPAPDQPLQRVQGRATTLCVVQWCPSKHADNSWHGWNLCEVHFADLMNANVLVVRDATGDVLAEEAAAYLRRNGGAA